MQRTDFGFSRRAALGIGLGSVAAVAIPGGAAPAAAAPPIAVLPTAIVVEPVAYPGVDPTGVADSTAAIQQAIDDCPSGGQVLVPAGRYRIAGTLTSSGKSFSFIGEFATLVKSSTARLLQFNGGYDAPIVVTAMTDAALPYADRDQLGLRVSLNDVPSWSTGDIVKLVADDIIVGARPGSGGDQSRVGQFFTVHQTSGTTAELLGRRRATFSENVRIARIQRVRIRVSGFVITADAAGMANSETCTFSGLYMPEIHNVSVDTVGGPAIVFRGCYAYTATNIDVSFAIDDPATGAFGYGILDNASSFGRIQGLRALHVRHAYTDDTSRIAAGSEVVHYGGTFGTLVSDSVCQGATTAAWDTHSCSESVAFDRCTAIDSFRGFNLRGRKHSVRACAVSGAMNGLRLTSEGSTGDDSWGHTVEDFIAERVLAGAIIVDPYLGGARESRPSRISRVMVRDSVAPQVLISNASITLDGLEIDVAASIPAAAILVRSTNSDVVGRGWRIDLRRSAGFTDLTLVSARSSGSFTLDDSVVEWPAGAVESIRTMVASDRSVLVRVQGLQVPQRHANPSTDLQVGSSLVWSAGSDHSGFIERLDAAIATASAAGTISRSTDRVILVNCRTTSARNFADLLAGSLIGQLLVISNSELSTGRVTVRHGETRNTLLLGGTNKPLEPGESLTLIWSGTIWRQV